MYRLDFIKCSKFVLISRGGGGSSKHKNCLVSFGKNSWRSTLQAENINGAINLFAVTVCEMHDIV